MNLNQLKIFYLAAKHGSLSAAAESLYITQQAVTKGYWKKEYLRAQLTASSTREVKKEWPKAVSNPIAALPALWRRSARRTGCI